MILKKPYAFLIKYFKLINIIICLIAIYLAYKSYNIISFFNEYILNDYVGNYYEGFVNNYISPFIYLIIIILISLIIGIYLLFKYKKKPTKIYIFSFVYYLILIIYLIIIKNVMITLESNVITAETARIYRDVSVIMVIPQLIIIILYLFRGLGFNIKKFNFEKDLKELEIEEKDSEEVEIVLNKDNVKLKRTINRFIREFKYYVKENKFIFSIICLVLIILIGFLIYKAFPEIIDRNYNQGDEFLIKELTYKIEDSIITNLDYNGKYIDEDKYFVVIKLNIKNNTKKNIGIDYNNIRLIIRNNYVYPSIDKGKYFIDYAKDLYTKEIKANSSVNYSLVYQIDKKDLKKNYEIKIASGDIVSDNLLVGKHDYIKISPTLIDKVNVVGNFKVDEEISFINTYLGNTTLKLSNPKITDKYVYDYEYCFYEECKKYKDVINVEYTKNNKILLVLDYDYKIDENSPFYSTSTSINTFIKTFMNIKYTDKNNNITYATVEDVTPNKLKDKIVIETSKDILDSNVVDLSIIIRNKEYLIKIK